MLLHFFMCTGKSVRIWLIKWESIARCSRVDNIPSVSHHILAWTQCNCHRELHTFPFFFWGEFMLVHFNHSSIRCVNCSSADRVDCVVFVFWARFAHIGDESYATSCDFFKPRKCLFILENVVEMLELTPASGNIVAFHSSSKCNSIAWCYLLE